LQREQNESYQMKYETPENKPTMASEPIFVAPVEVAQPKVPTHPFTEDANETLFDRDDAPCQYHVEEALYLLEKSQEDYRNGRVHSSQEVTDMLRSLCL